VVSYLTYLDTFVVSGFVILCTGAFASFMIYIRAQVRRMNTPNGHSCAERISVFELIVLL
jgi:hypothetical protein